MCSMYWNLNVDGTAPCGHEINHPLQTHFMGEPGSCVGYYNVGDVVPELEGFTGNLPEDDRLAGECDECDQFYEFDAVIEQGRVVRLTDCRVVSLI